MNKNKISSLMNELENKTETEINADYYLKYDIIKNRKHLKKIIFRLIKKNKINIIQIIVRDIFFQQSLRNFFDNNINELILNTNISIEMCNIFKPYMQHAGINFKRQQSPNKKYRFQKDFVETIIYESKKDLLNFLLVNDIIPIIDFIETINDFAYQIFERQIYLIEKHSHNQSSIKKYDEIINYINTIVDYAKILNLFF